MRPSTAIPPPSSPSGRHAVPRATLLEAADEIDTKLKKVDDALATVRMGEERRASSFKEELRHFGDAVDDTLQYGRNEFDALIQEATLKRDEAREEISRLREEG